MEMYSNGVRIWERQIIYYRSIAYVCLFVAFIFPLTPSSSTDGSNASENSQQSSALYFVKYKNLSDKERDATVTIEFNFGNITKPTRSVLNATYLKIRKATIIYLNRSKLRTIPSTTATSKATTMPAVVFSTATPVSFVVTIRALGRNERELSAHYTNEHLRFVESEPALEKNILRVSLFIHRLDVPNPGELLYKALTNMEHEGILTEAAEAPVKTIYRGPADKPETSDSTSVTYNCVYISFQLFLLVASYSDIFDVV